MNVSLPKVLIGGFPRSGTSFLCNLVVEMGFSPGSPKNLKPADDNNLWGYWEHLPIRDLTWLAAFRHPNGARKYTQKKFFRRKVLGWNHPMARKIQKVAIRDNVEVYKDVMLPLAYRLFPETCKAILIERHNLDRMYVYRWNRWSYETFLRSLEDYRELMGRMASEVSCLTVCYENFQDNFDSQAERIAGFLNVKVDVERLRKIFRK